MEILMGNLYFVSDDLFTKIADPYLKINYENTKRPHYFAFLDDKTGLYWLVPCSSKIDKKVINLLRRGVRFTPTQPDVIRIEQIMLEELSADT